MQATQDDLLAQIRAAFPAQPIRFDRALAGGLDGGAYRRHVDGKSWEELDRAYVLARSDALSFLDPDHLAAVLPVYLRSLVEDGTRTPVPDTLLLVLNRKSEQAFEEVFGALSSAQRAVVVAVLDAFAAAESGQPSDAARETAERWKRRLSTNP